MAHATVKTTKLSVTGMEAIAVERAVSKIVVAQSKKKHASSSAELLMATSAFSLTRAVQSVIQHKVSAEAKISVSRHIRLWARLSRFLGDLLTIAGLLTGLWVIIRR